VGIRVWVSGPTCTSGAASVLFTFDALDRALTRDYDGTTTAYTYSGIFEQLAQTVAGTTATTFASTPGGHPTAQKVGSAQANYHLLDTHSDVVGLVSSAAANQGTTFYDAYGGVLATTGTQGILGYSLDRRGGLRRGGRARQELARHATVRNTLMRNGRSILRVGWLHLARPGPIHSR
jgi:hypothetical protein